MKTLFIIGAQRSGSTYLYHLLNEHPQITMAKPICPEPKFFLNESSFIKGLKYYEQKYFNNVSYIKNNYIGEKSTSYIEYPEVAFRIKSYYPDARILIILRNPVFRAYSNYHFSVTNNIENKSFRDAVQSESIRLQEYKFNTSVNPYAYVQRGYYSNFLLPYFKLFPKQQIQVLIFEDIINNVHNIQQLYQWLGVDALFKPKSIDEVCNSVSGISGMNYEKSDEILGVFKELVSLYQPSLDSLELLLEQKINIWRKQWETL